MKKQRKNFILSVLGTVVLAAFLLGACSKQPTPPALEESQRRNKQGDVCLSEHAGPYIEAFQKEYPDMYISKVRWQKLPTGSETYIIEGIKDNKKSIVKYLMGSERILGRVERDLNEEELENGVCIEYPLDLTGILTQTELFELAHEHLGPEIFELRVSWKGEHPVAYVEVMDERSFTKYAKLNAVTGEVIHKQ